MRTGRGSAVARRARRGTTAAAAVAAAALFVTGCTVGPSSSGPDGSTPATSPPAPSAGAPSGSGLDSFYGQKLDWENCGSGLQCAALLVPLDYSDPGGATIKVQVNRLPASGKRVGSLVVNPGGPGGSGLDYVRNSGPGAASPPNGS